MQLEVSKTFDDINAAYRRDIYRHIIAYGGSRSGKSYSILQLFCLLLISRKNLKITVWRNLRIDAVATVLEDFKNIVNSDATLQMMYQHNKKDGTFLCRSTGSIILFGGTENVSKVLGLAQDISFFNEISEFSEDVFNQIVQRTRETVFIDYNPSREFFIDKYKTHEDTIFLRSTYLDNIEFLTKGIVNKLESYNPYEKGSVTISDDLILMHKGKLVSDKNQPPPNLVNVKNGTANRYLYEVYCLGLKSEKPNRVYRGWETCDDIYFNALEYESYFGLDFGSSSPTALIEAKYDGDRTFYLHQRLYKPSSEFGMDIALYLTEMVSPAITPKDFLICDSAKKTIVDDLKNSGLMAIGAIKGSGSLQKRITKVQSFNIVYTKSSKDLEDEYYDYSFALDRYGLTTDKIDNRNKDHLLDASGYVIDWMCRYLGI